MDTKEWKSTKNQPSGERERVIHIHKTSIPKLKDTGAPTPIGGTGGGSLYASGAAVCQVSETRADVIIYTGRRDATRIFL